MMYTGKLMSLVLASAAIGAAAQSPSNTPIRLVVGFPAGGQSDTIARILAEPLQKELGRTVIVENKVGVGGAIAGETVKSATPNGTSYLIGPDGWAVFRSLIYPAAQLKYQFPDDFAPVARLVSFPMALVASASTGATDAKSFQTWLKANPARAHFGTTASGSLTQFLGALTSQAMGAPLTAVPYKGNAPLVVDLLGGQVPSGILVLSDILKHRSEKLHVLGVIAEKRWSLAPDVPTLKEQGFDVTPGMGWQAMWAPAKTPAADIQRMEAALKKILAQPEVRQRLESSAVVTPDFASAAQLDEQIRRDLAFWKPVIEASGFKPD